MKDKPPDGGCSWFCRRHPDMVGGSFLVLRFQNPCCAHSGVFCVLLDFTIHYSTFTIPPQAANVFA